MKLSNDAVSSLEQKENQKQEAAAFYKALFTIVGPIAIQNLISAAVSSADVIMLNFIGQAAIAAVSLASYIQFVLFIFLTGLASGMTILTSQYWGKKDTFSIETFFGFAMKASVTFGILFALLSLFFPEFLMRIFTNETELVEIGADYLRIVSLSYVLLSISNVFEAILKSIEHVKIVTAIIVIALVTNIILNGFFIFGWWGAPKLGVKGVALATTIARILEFILCLAVSLKIKEVKLNIRCLFRKNSLLFNDFLRYTLPALGNEVVWGVGWAMYAVILGHLGQDIVAANSVVNVLRNLGSVVCFGMAYGGAILIGKYTGANNLELAKRNASRLAKSTIFSGFLGALFMIACLPLLYKFADLNETATSYMSYILFISALSVFGSSINTVLICGIFRAGGDSKFGFITDMIAMWGVSVPLGLICAFVLKLPPLAVYTIMYIDEFEKMGFVIYHYKSGKWLKNITRDFNTEVSDTNENTQK